MDYKKRVIEALKKVNYFDSFDGKKDSLETLEKSEKLEDVIIRVEMACNTDQPAFRFNSDAHTFCRVILNQEDQELARREARYAKRKSCEARGCRSQEIEFENFIQLLNRQFEAISVTAL